MSKHEKIRNLLDKLFDEWCATVVTEGEALATLDFSKCADIWDIPGASGTNERVNEAGQKYLVKATQMWLHQEGLERKISFETMLNALGKAFSDQITPVRRGHLKVFNPDKVTSKARRAIDRLKETTRVFVLPAIFAPSAKNSDIRVGPVRIVSKEILLAEASEPIAKHQREHTSPFLHLANDWMNYGERFDHFLAVRVHGYDSNIGWIVARQAAEFALNLIRLSHGYRRTKNIKLAGGYVQEDRSAKLWFDERGDAYFSTRDGPWGSHLQDGWFDLVDQLQGGFSGLWSDYANIIASGMTLKAPVLERQNYAHQLISEAYCEPHDHIRLVRVMSALEALAMPAKNEIQESLAYRCALAGGWGDTVRATDIYEKVRTAYGVRSSIVHGRGAQAEDIGEAFYQTEEYLIDIVQGFAALYVGIDNAVAPNSVQKLEKEIGRRVHAFFWSPHIALSDSQGFQLAASI